jgi:hypothetical protein
MGGGVSSLPNQLNEADLRNYAGDRFSEAKFCELKDEAGFVTREAVLKEQEKHDPSKKLVNHKSMPESGVINATRNPPSVRHHLHV